MLRKNRQRALERQLGRIGNPTACVRIWPRFWASQACRSALSARWFKASRPKSADFPMHGQCQAQPAAQRRSTRCFPLTNCCADRPQSPAPVRPPRPNLAQPRHHRPSAHRTRPTAAARVLARCAVARSPRRCAAPHCPHAQRSGCWLAGQCTQNHGTCRLT